jgi:hypothetical protein
MCRPHANIPVQYPNIKSETVDVTLVAMAIIWLIIKDRAFLSITSTLIPSYKI